MTDANADTSRGCRRPDPRVSAPHVVATVAVPLAASAVSIRPASDAAERTREQRGRADPRATRPSGPASNAADKRHCTREFAVNGVPPNELGESGEPDMTAESGSFPAGGDQP